MKMLNKIQTSIYRLSPRAILLLFITVGFVNLLLYQNKTFYVSYPNGVDDYGATTYKNLYNVDRDQYWQLIKEVGSTMYSETQYFGTLPGWTINIVYLAYFFLICIVILKLNRRTI